MKLINKVSDGNAMLLTKGKQTFEFKIGNNAKILDILRSKMYSHPIRTLVQEYLCNARDAVREVGTQNIVVTLPTSKDNVFSVRDFGPGISKDRMSDIFVQYGNTTKDTSNNQTGGFGLGGKLAFAYCDMFYIKTYINGELTTYRAHLGANRDGALDLMDVESTTEANGTEIRIPVQSDDFREFDQAVQRAVFFWDVKPTLLNGYLEQHDAIVLSKSISLYTPEAMEIIGNVDGIVLSIDGIAYPLSSDFISEYKSLSKVFDLVKSNGAVVFKLGNGVVEVAASRESISENERTLNAVEKKAIEALALIKAWEKDLLDSSANLAGFITNAKTLISYVRNHQFNWKSYRINNGYSDLTLSSDEIQKLEILVSGGYRSRRSKSSYLNLNKPILFVDEEISKAKLEKKLKGYLPNQVISKGTSSIEFIKTLASAIGSNVSSSYSLPEVERASAKRASPGTVNGLELVSTSYVSRKSTHEVSIYLELNEHKWVYISKDNMKGVGEYKSLQVLLKSNNMRLVVLGVNAIKQVVDNKDFISVDTFLSDIKKVIGAKAYAKFYNSIGSYFVDGAVSWLWSMLDTPNAIGKVKDASLKANLYTCLQFNNISYPLEFTKGDVLTTHMLAKNREMNRLVELKASLPKYLRDNYPLLSCISKSDHIATEEELDNANNYNLGYSEKEKALKKLDKFTTEKFNAEVVAYLNGKFKKV